MGKKKTKSSRKRKNRQGTSASSPSQHSSSDVASERHRSKKPKKADESQPPATLRRLRGTAESTLPPPEWTGSTSKAFLTPQDGPDFESCLEQSYRGFVWEEPNELPTEFHASFDDAFDALQEAGLFLYDAVQAGGKKVSYTFVKRTLVGNPGSTYRYLGLRLFSHPWSAVTRDGAELTMTAGTNKDRTHSCDTTSLIELGYTKDCAKALLKLGNLNQSLAKRTRTLLDRELPHVNPVGPSDYSLTLINRMAPTWQKKNLKRETRNGMGKTSVSWHKDSGLMDFSSIAVYHSLREATNQTGGKKEEDPWRVALRVADSSSSTPPLAVPLESGALYYLLDEFNHNHEHAVLAGSNQLRYSSTHRVAREGQGTWQYLKEKCESVFKLKASLVKLTRAQQQLLTEIEFEWLRQWYVQGRLHASLHPYWHRPIQKLESWFCELERRTVRLIQRFGDCDDREVSENVFDVLIEAVEARRKLREAWKERLSDPLFSSMAENTKPFPCPVLDRETTDPSSQLPEELNAFSKKIRKYRKSFGKRNKESHSKTLALTKKERRQVASNWKQLQSLMKGK